MSKARPHTVKHTTETGISSPSLPPPDRGRARSTTSAGSGARPTPSKAPIANSVSADPETLGRGTPGMASVRKSRSSSR
jgi:hypothetical protein